MPANLVLRAMRNIAVGLVMAVAGTLFTVPAAQANWVDDVKDLLTPEFLAQVWPGEEITLGEPEGRPLAIPVFVDGEQVGYLISTKQVGNYGGYAGSPFDVVAGFTNTGQVTGAAMLLSHSEPIIGHGVPQSRLERYLAQLNTVHIWNRYTAALQPNVTQGATISAGLMRDAVILGARVVIRTRGDVYVGPPTVDRTGFEALAWEDLISGGSMVRLSLTNRDVAEAFALAGYNEARPDIPLGEDPDGTFLEFFAALATPASIGQNILRQKEYENFSREFADQMFILAGVGEYDFKGEAYRHAANQKRFDRVQIVQNGNVIYFHGDQYKYKGRLETGQGREGKVLNQAGVFGVDDPLFDPLAPFMIQVLVHGTADDAAITIPFEVAYQLPARHILGLEEEEMAMGALSSSDARPIWVQAWIDQQIDVAVLAVALIILTIMLIKQDAISRHRYAYKFIRLGFLAFTLGWLGWYANAQLSMINVLVYLQAPFRDLAWTSYMVEPLIVIVAGYTVFSLFIWGRSLFCGWLCPFGALQEFLARIAKLFRIPQFQVSRETHKKLWPLKYVVFAALVPLAFFSPEVMVGAVEVEPFKTAITSHFQNRGFWFVVYAVAVLAVGLVMERAYCRFLCPLGAGLAAAGRFNLVRFLKRKPECGTPEGETAGGCHLCEVSCEFQAIEPSGRIDESECFYCLDCQVEYFDDQRCPPLAVERKRRERGLPPKSAQAPGRKTFPGGLVPQPAE
ncbi:MAG: 4Fe-4S binding protein [Alphaproteobacteria bacterium]|nr:4Fe-4S binding protein [Alphaproteobacteria bacterium]